MAYGRTPPTPAEAGIKYYSRPRPFGWIVLHDLGLVFVASPVFWQPGNDTCLVDVSAVPHEHQRERSKRKSKYERWTKVTLFARHLLCLFSRQWSDASVQIKPGVVQFAIGITGLGMVLARYRRADYDGLIIRDHEIDLCNTRNFSISLNIAKPS